MEKVNENALGLTLGTFVGGVHLIWVILVGAGVAQPLVDWFMSMHFLTLSYTFAPFALWTALGLVVLTFVVGYVVGWVFGALFNAYKK